MRFDGMAGSLFDAEFLDVAHSLARQVNGMLCAARPRLRYREVVNLDVGGRTAVWLGRDDVNESIYFEAKGETTPEVTSAVRSLWPEHSVTRADVCLDYDQEGAFPRLQGVVREHKGPRVWGGYRALPDDETQGRTWEAGKRGKGSVAMIRVYEAGKHPDRLHFNRPDWVRVELEAHPHYAKDKRAAATFEPEQFWGLSAWTHRVGQALTGLDIQRYEAEVRQQTFDKTTAYIATKFRRHLKEMLATFGDAECVFREFESVWSEDDRKKGIRRAA